MIEKTKQGEKRERKRERKDAGERWGAGFPRKESIPTTGALGLGRP